MSYTWMTVLFSTDSVSSMNQSPNRSCYLDSRDQLEPRSFKKPNPIPEKLKRDETSRQTYHKTRGAFLVSDQF